MEIILLKMILVGLYFWYPCRLLGNSIFKPPEGELALDLACVMIGVFIHCALFVVFLLCGGCIYLPNCGGH